MGIAIIDPRALVAQIEEAAKQLAVFSDDSRSDLGDVLSPSRVRGFLDCSARSWYKYGLGLPDPGGASLVRGPRPALVRSSGSAQTWIVETHSVYVTSRGPGTQRRCPWGRLSSSITK
jgi:hypothetical protein